MKREVIIAFELFKRSVKNDKVKAILEYAKDITVTQSSIEETYLKVRVSITSAL